MCHGEHKGIADFENGIGHLPNCPYAEARWLLDEIKKDYNEETWSKLFEISISQGDKE